jgi:hypothetical protein
MSVYGPELRQEIANLRKDFEIAELKNEIKKLKEKSDA